MPDTIALVDLVALAEVRDYAGWTTAIDPCLVAAAKQGRLAAIVTRVRAKCSDSYSHLPNWEATFWPLLEQALLDDVGCRRSNATIVYLVLLKEGVDVWRPVHAEHVGGDLYRLTDESGDGESWPFGRGDVVRCEARTLYGNPGRPERVLVVQQPSANVNSTS